MPFPKSSILSQLKDFLPKLKQSTEELMNNEELREKWKIDINDTTEEDSEMQNANEDEQNEEDASKGRLDRLDVFCGLQIIVSKASWPASLRIKL